MASTPTCTMALVLVKESGEHRVIRCVDKLDSTEKGFAVNGEHWNGHHIRPTSSGVSRSLTIDPDREETRPLFPGGRRGCGFGFWFENDYTGVTQLRCPIDATHSGFHRVGRAKHWREWENAEVRVYSVYSKRLLLTLPGYNYSVGASDDHVVTGPLPLPKYVKPGLPPAPTFEEIRTDLTRSIGHRAKRLMEECDRLYQMGLERPFSAEMLSELEMVSTVRSKVIDLVTSASFITLTGRRLVQ